jgi:iron complex outermembrane receptor protein
MRTTAIATAVSLAIINLAAASEAAAAIRKSTNVPGQELGPALRSLARERDFQLVYRTETVGKVRTSGAVGELTSDEALTQLLNGTGLTYRYIDDNTVTIIPIAGGGSSSPQATGGSRPAQEKPPERKSWWRRLTLAQADEAASTDTPRDSTATSIDRGAADAAAEKPALEEIIVTANRRVEVLQDVPAAITAISGEILARDGVTGLDGVANRTPGLTFAAFAQGQPEIAIRGVGTKEDGVAASDSTVVSIDEVYIAARSSQVFDLFDLERVEVLRGPQGTLYGKNSIGGSINFVTLQPSEQTHVRGSLTAGRFGRLDGGALVSGALSDELFGKVAVSYRSGDGWLRNVLPGPNFGERWGETESFGYRSTLRWVPDRLEVSLTLDGAHDDNGATNREPVGARAFHDCDCASDPLAVNEFFGGNRSPYDTVSDLEGKMDRDIFGATLRVNYSFDAATLTFISGYRQSDYYYLEDSSGIPASSVVTDLTGASGNPNLTLLGPVSNGFTFKATGEITEDPEQYTQELRLTSASGGRFDWLAGLFFTREENFRTERFGFPALGGPDRRPSYSLSLQSNKGTAYAGYSQASFAVTDSFKLTGGVRYSYEKKDITSENRLESGVPIVLRPYARVAAEEDWSNVSWRLIGDFVVAPDVMLYASVATGFRSGGFTGSASTAQVATAPFDPEEATNYEVGAKTELFGNRLRLNTSVFYTDYSDLQVTRFFQPAGQPFGQFITENAGKAELKGVEVEFSARPVEWLELGGSYAYLDATYTNFTGLPSQTVAGNFNGNHLRQSMENSASAYAGYIHALGSGAELSLRGNWKYQSLSYYDPDNNPITVIPSYHLFEARLGYLSPGGHWDWSLWGKNLGQERYRTHIFSQRDGRVSFALFGEPRTYGMTVSYKY